MSYIFPSHVLKAPNAFALSFHLSQNIKPPYFHNLNKFNKFQMSLKEVEKILI
jgi:hypothetical protein